MLQNMWYYFFFYILQEHKISILQNNPKNPPKNDAIYTL